MLIRLVCALRDTVTATASDALRCNATTTTTKLQPRSIAWRLVISWCAPRQVQTAELMQGYHVINTSHSVVRTGRNSGDNICLSCTQWWWWCWWRIMARAIWRDNLSVVEWQAVTGAYHIRTKRGRMKALLNYRHDRLLLSKTSTGTINFVAISYTFIKPQLSLRLTELCSTICVVCGAMPIDRQTDRQASRLTDGWVVNEWMDIICMQIIAHIALFVDCSCHSEELLELLPCRALISFERVHLFSSDHQARQTDILYQSSISNQIEFQF